MTVKKWSGKGIRRPTVRIEHNLARGGWEWILHASNGNLVSRSPRVFSRRDRAERSWHTAAALSQIARIL